MFTGFDRALASSIASPQFAAVLPSPDFGSIPIAISVPAGEEPLLDFANAFVEVGTAGEVFQQKLDYWIKGGAQMERELRWFIAAMCLDGGNDTLNGRGTRPRHRSWIEVCR